MAINFGGLATGMDTNTLIAELMKAERRPIERLQREKSYQTSRLGAFNGFETRLKTLLSRFTNLATADKVHAYKVTTPTDAYFSASGNSKAVPGSFQVEVRNLAQVQKDVSQGYASKTDNAFGAGTMTINLLDVDAEGEEVVIDSFEIAYDGDSLTTLAEKINAANMGENATGVSASIINDGTANGFRLVLTGKDSESSFRATVVESEPPGEGGYLPPAFANTQPAQMATILVDNIEIKSKTNVFDEAIPGVTLTLNKPHEANDSTVATVAFDKGTLKDKVQGFVTAYNDVVSFISQQADASWGRDPSFRAVQRRLQTLLVTSVGGGTLNTLSQLGIKTDAKAGTLTLETATLDAMIDEDLEGVEQLFAGGDGVEGISTKFVDYLKGMTDSVDGLYAGRKQTNDIALRKIDSSIDRNERRLEMREKSLRAQFESLETLVSSLNATSNFLSQQITMMNNLWSRK